MIITATAVPLTISEDAYQDLITRYATSRGWTWVHIPTSLVAGKYRTAYEGTPGLPDLILARDGVVWLFEVKTQSGRLRLKQKEWLTALGIYGRIVRPSDWPQIRELLT